MYIHLKTNVILLFLTLIFTIHNVCNKHITFQQKVGIFYIWLVSFLPFAFIPVEIEELLFESTESSKISPNKHLLELTWKIYYWSNFINGWIIIPLWLGYLQSGFFRNVDRFKDSVTFNLKYYLILLFLLMSASVIIIFSYAKNASQLFVESHLLLNSLSFNKVLSSVSRFLELWSM